MDSKGVMVALHSTEMWPASGFNGTNLGFGV